MKVSSPNFILKGEVSVEDNGKIIDYKVEFQTDGTIKQEDGEAWLRLTRMKANDTYLNIVR